MRTAWVGATLTRLDAIAGSCMDLAMACVTSAPDMDGGSDTVARLCQPQDLRTLVPHVRTTALQTQHGYGQRLQS